MRQQEPNGSSTHTPTQTPHHQALHTACDRLLRQELRQQHKLLLLALGSGGGAGAPPGRRASADAAAGNGSAPVEGAAEARWIP
jgi:hypothetical protein